MRKWREDLDKLNGLTDEEVLSKFAVRVPCRKPGADQPGLDGSMAGTRVIAFSEVLRQLGVGGKAFEAWIAEKPGRREAWAAVKMKALWGEIDGGE